MEFCHEFSHLSGSKGRPSLYFEEVLEVRGIHALR